MKKALKLTAMIAALIIVMSAAGCSFVSQEDLEDLESQIEDLEAQIEDLEDSLDEIQSGKEDSTLQNADNTQSDSESAVPEDDSETPQQADTSEFSAQEVLSQLEVSEYTYLSDYSSHLFLVVKNNSQYNLTLYGEAIFKDGDGALIGTNSAEERAFEPGQEIILDFYNEDSFAGYEYSLSADLETYYTPVLSNLEKEVTVTDSKVILAVTNNGDKAAEFVSYTILFFSGDTVVDYGWGYCTDGDSEIKAGNTNYDESTTYEEFDSVLVFLSGRASD